jgi:lactoylglutathione lyase
MGIPAEAVQGKYGRVPDGYKHVFRQLAFVKDPDVSEGLIMEEAE